MAWSDSALGKCGSWTVRNLLKQQLPHQTSRGLFLGETLHKRCLWDSVRKSWGGLHRCTPSGNYFPHAVRAWVHQPKGFASIPSQRGGRKTHISSWSVTGQWEPGRTLLQARHFGCRYHPGCLLQPKSHLCAGQRGGTASRTSWAGVLFTACPRWRWLLLAGKGWRTRFHSLIVEPQQRCHKSWTPLATPGVSVLALNDPLLLTTYMTFVRWAQQMQCVIPLLKFTRSQTLPQLLWRMAAKQEEAKNGQDGEQQ